MLLITLHAMDDHSETTVPIDTEEFADRTIEEPEVLDPKFNKKSGLQTNNTPTPQKGKVNEYAV